MLEPILNLVTKFIEYLKELIDRFRASFHKETGFEISSHPLSPTTFIKTKARTETNVPVIEYSLEEVQNYAPYRTVPFPKIKRLPSPINESPAPHRRIYTKWVSFVAVMFLMGIVLCILTIVFPLITPIFIFDEICTAILFILSAVWVLIDFASIAGKEN